LKPLWAGALAVTAALAAAPDATANPRYTVRAGDTLSGIAVAHHTTARTLARLNGLKVDGVLIQGRVLKLPASCSMPASTPASAGSGRYVVRRGDSLSAIAVAHHTTARTLARLNGLKVDGVLVEGRVLKLPTHASHTTTTTSHATASAGSLRYVVHAGDTLSGIASRAGTTLSALAQVNGLKPSGVLITGTILRLPSGAHAPHGSSGATADNASRSSVSASIDHWAAHYGVDVHLVRALAWQESGYQSSVVSPAGAAGVMQVTPTTWAYVERYLLGQHVAHTTDGNVRVGVAFLAHLLEAFPQSRSHAIAAYYQGEESVRRRGILDVSRTYIANVLALAARL
jgi:N-acetylmuramoyl-L-alanine amidase